MAAWSAPAAWELTCSPTSPMRSRPGSATAWSPSITQRKGALAARLAGRQSRSVLLDGAPAGVHLFFIFFFSNFLLLNFLNEICFQIFVFTTFFPKNLFFFKFWSPNFLHTVQNIWFCKISLIQNFVCINLSLFFV